MEHFNIKSKIIRVICEIWTFNLLIALLSKYTLWVFGIK